MSALDQALALARAGYYLAPVTIRRNPVTGRKMPTYHGKWGELSTVDVEVIRDWYVQHGPDVSFCVDTGKSGVVAVDLDVSDDQDAVIEWAVNDMPAGGVVVNTPSGGMHHYWRAVDTPVGNSKGAIAPGVDVRGVGGHVYAPGSRIVGDVAGYELQGALVPAADLPALPSEVLAKLPTDARRTRDPREPRAHGARHDRDWVTRLCASQLDKVRTAEPREGIGFRDVLMGAALVYGRAVAAGLVGRGRAETVLGDAVHHVWGCVDEDDAQWISDGLDDGEADPWTVTEPPPAASGAAADADSVDEVGEHAPQEGRPDSSWQPIDLAADWDDDIEPERPTLLPRDDGPCLLYPGRTHSIYGESESGKSWVALILVARVLRDGGTALYIDHESDKGPIKARLRALGVTRDMAGRLTYVRPDGPRDAAWLLILERAFTVAVIDGVSVAIANDGSSSDSTDETARWLEQVPRALEVRTGAAVLTVDHVTKARDGRGRFAIGSQAKLNAISGAAYTARVHKPFGRGQTGELVLRITKDRPGGIRPHCGPAGEHGTQEAARVLLDATDPDRIKVALQGWSEEGDEEHDLPYGAPIEPPTSWRDSTAPLPDDVVGYTGAGASAVLDLARFMRHSASGGIGQTLTDARRALALLRGEADAVRHQPHTIRRAWGALLDLGRIGLVNPDGAPGGAAMWIRRDSE